MTLLLKSNKPSAITPIGLVSQLGKNHYSTTTNGVEITAWPEFIDSQSVQLGNLFIWAYHIRISNFNSHAVKLLTRHWKIIDERGGVQEVDGEGVIGEQPNITAGECFQYSSGVHLRHPSGIMTGHYQMQKDDGELFNAAIPAFSLDVPSLKNVIN